MVWSPSFECVVRADGDRSWRVGNDQVGRPLRAASLANILLTESALTADTGTYRTDTQNAKPQVRSYSAAPAGTGQHETLRLEIQGVGQHLQMQGLRNGFSTASDLASVEPVVVLGRGGSDVLDCLDALR